MTRATNRFQTGRDRNAVIKLLRFQQTIVGGIKVVSLDVKAGQRQTMPRRFFRVLMQSGNFAHALAQGNRSRTPLQRHFQALHRAIR